MRLTRIVLALSLIDLIGSSSTADATTLVLMRTETIARAADEVVAGTVVAVESRWRGRRIVTLVRMRPDQRGQPDLWFEHPGGTVDGVTMHVVGMPGFRPGERALVMLARRAGARHLIGLADGKLAIVVRDGKEVVYLRRRDEGPLESVALTDAVAVLVRARGDVP